METTEKKTAWWKFVIAMLLFWPGALLAQILVAGILGIIGLLTPRAYRRLAIGNEILACIASVCLCTEYAYSITGSRHKMFWMINCVVATVIYAMLFVLELIFSTELAGIIDVAVMAIMYCVHAVLIWKRE